MSDPVVNNYGPATWTDFQHNWRKADGDFLQTRSILRYQTTAARNAISSPQPGMTIYNAETDRLEVRVAAAGGSWNGLYSVDGLIIEAVPTDTVRLRHEALADGMVFTPTQITTAVPLGTAGGEVKFDATGLTISTGTKSVKLTTDADSLNSDTLISAPALKSTGTLGISGVSTFTGAVSMSSTLTVTGLLTANANITAPDAPTATTHLTNKSYVDAGDAARLSLSGGTMNNYILIHQDNAAAGGLCLRLRDAGNKPYLDWMDWAGNQLGFIQAVTATMTMYSKGDIVLNSGGGQVRTTDAVYATGQGRFYTAAQQVICIGTDPYIGFYNGTSVDSYGTRAGYVGFTSDNYMHINNEQTNSSIFFDTDYVHQFRCSGNYSMGVYNGYTLLGKSSTQSAYTYVGISLFETGTQYITRNEDGTTMMYLNRRGSPPSGRAYIHFLRNDSAVGQIVLSGSSGTAYQTTSDYRAKTIIGPITHAVERLMALRPWRATFHGDDQRGEVDVFVAHELAEVIPDAVTGEKDAVDEEGAPVHQGTDYGRPVPLMVAAIQELVGRVERLEAA